MLERVDEHEGDVSRLRPGDYRRIVDLCWQCKLCFNHCPYTPPHRFDLDFPRLMLRAKAARVKEEGIPFRDRVLGEIDKVGPIATATASLANWASDYKPHRVMLETVLGIHRDRLLPRFNHKTFARWFRERRPERAPREGTRPTVLFFTCLVNYNEAGVGRDTLAVLEKNGCAVSCPPQVCCGMPFLDGGDVPRATENAKRNLESLLPLVKAGAEVVVPQPTCSYVIKQEYPHLVPGEAAETVAGKTRDLFEYLAGRHREGTLATDFAGPGPGKVAYQAPCHLRAQNMGHKTRDVLQLIPGTTVQVVERCTAMDGGWAMKKEFYPVSLGFAHRAALEMEAAAPDTYATDCSLSALQIEDVRGVKPRHPATILREAYGLDDER
jgi:glycerol-3-phosphate dehydrogenase subunit C